MIRTRVAHAGESELRRQVLERCDWLGQHALVKLVAILFRARGYRDIRIVGRKSWRGRGEIGGADIACRIRSIVDDGRTLVQVKAYGPVQRRFVDELRGVMLREDCKFGVVVATRRFSAEAKRAAGAQVGLPVALIGGAGLARMLVESGIGVRKDPFSPFGSRLVVDDLFFELLQDNYPDANRR